ncbi:TRAP transporter large permease subunit [Marinobacter sp. BGYM27]|uniref:TRAP transporter large permease n=1 Tax=Marinobacter sp. BGYM27 TaxID=2975597 RepID=UPI0021A4ADBD|nr:TRAP transporter large permease subunit [Marinobacter sp. BGYM27]MDG5501466.1 TRAP transporter large permease subunit [Marinobacter sp. BGYM27]
MSGFIEFLPLVMFAVVCVVLMAGYPVAFSLAGTALAFAFGGTLFGVFDTSFLGASPNRLFGLLTNQTLIAVPLFIFMGCMLQQSKIAENLLESMAEVFKRMRGGLGISVAVVGMLLAASTGIVGATVVTMGLISLPTMLKRGYSPSLATGTICATGTLGQIIPPSIALVLLGDVMSSAYQRAQRDMGIFSPDTVSVGDLFVGALIPGLLLVLLYIIYIIAVAYIHPNSAPNDNRTDEEKRDRDLNIWRDLTPPLILIVAVLGSILSGIATPTEAAGVGALGASILAAIKRQMSVEIMRNVCQQTTRVTCMVFLILIGAAIFSLVFRGYGGDILIHDIFTNMPGGAVGAMIVVMIVIFLLGFILDFIEITFVVVPIVAPVLLKMGIDPVWLGIMIALNLQTSFLTPPFGFSLFYLRGVAPPEIKTSQIYRGVIPFIAIQVLMLIMLAIWPVLATGLPEYFYG